MIKILCLLELYVGNTLISNNILLTVMSVNLSFLFNHLIICIFFCMITKQFCDRIKLSMYKHRNIHFCILGSLVWTGNRNGYNTPNQCQVTNLYLVPNSKFRRLSVRAIALVLDDISFWILNTVSNKILCPHLLLIYTCSTFPCHQTAIRARVAHWVR